jgi:hypothetical protein
MARRLTQIIEKKTRRLRRPAADFDFWFFEQEWQSTGDARNSLMDLVPIRLVTIMENCLRSVVEEAVDHGDPYASRAITMISKLSGKVIAESLLAISRKEITLGNLAAHGLATGSVAEIIASLEAIFGENIKAELETTRTKWINPEDNHGLPIVENLPQTFGQLDRLLKIRHILVHELPHERPYIEDDIPVFFTHAKQFATALEWAAVGRLYGSVPMRQGEMNAVAASDNAAAIAELNDLRGGTSSDFQSPKAPRAEIEYHWDRFCDLLAQDSAGYLSGELPGTIAPLLYSSKHARLTRWRIEDIKRDLNMKEGGL